MKRFALGQRYGTWIYRFRWFILTGWIAVLLSCIPLARSVSSVLSNTGYTVSPSESSTVNDILTRRLHHPISQLLVVFHATATHVSDPSYQQEVSAFLARAKHLAHVTQVVQGGSGLDQQTTFVTLGFDEAQDRVDLPSIRALLPQNGAGPAQTYLTGEPAVSQEIQLDTQVDTEHAELVAMPITLLMLVLVFGSLSASLLPLLLAATALPTTLAIIDLVAIHTETNIFVLNVASILGLGLSIDYSLFLVRRFREELTQRDTVCDAVSSTLATAGEVVVFSGMCVAIGFAGLFCIGLPVMNAFAEGGMIVASITVIAALTLLPALFEILGTRINTGVLPWRGRRGSTLAYPKQAEDDRSGWWFKWAMLVMRHPIAIVCLVCLALVSWGWPVLSLHPGTPGVSALPQHSEARTSVDLLHAQFPDLNTDPMYVLVKTPDGSEMLATQNRRRLASLSAWIARQTHVSEVVSLVSLPVHGGTKQYTPEQLALFYSTGAYKQVPALAQLVATTTQGDTSVILVRSDGANDQALIDQLRQHHSQASQGLSVLIGGTQASNLDFDRILYGNFLRALLFILGATYLLLLLMFRSVILPLKAIVMNMLSIGASYGVLIVGFQQGRFAPWLGFTPDGTIDRFVPILLFVTLFGLSMDYECFLLSRVREAWKQTGDNRTSVALGLERTGGIITNAALLFVVVSGSFIWTRLVVTQALGVGITVAILVDATIIRCLLVPASMRLLGTWNWWLPRLSRRA